MYRTGAAIPAISDDNFSRILIYLPTHSEIERISSVVKSSFQLREKANSKIRNIETKINIEHITNRVS